MHAALGTTFRNANYGGELGSNPFSGAGRFGSTRPTLNPTFPNYSPSPSYQPAPIYINTAPASQQQQRGGTLKLDNVFNTSTALLSQFFASRGARPTTQLTNSRDVTGITTATAPNQQQYENYPQNGGQMSAPGFQAGSAGGAVGSGIDGIVNFALANPLYIFLGIGGVYLLFREPPKSRR